ncbi:MAG: hypothetical protein ACLSTV_07225 [Coriobacteriales bacterium]
MSASAVSCFRYASMLNPPMEACTAPTGIFLRSDTSATVCTVNAEIPAIFSSFPDVQEYSRQKSSSGRAGRVTSSVEK